MARDLDKENDYETTARQVESLIARAAAPAFWIAITALVGVVSYSVHNTIGNSNDIIRISEWINGHSESKNDWIHNHERSDDARSAAFTSAINANADEIHKLQSMLSEARREIEGRLSTCEAKTVVRP